MACRTTGGRQSADAALQMGCQAGHLCNASPAAVPGDSHIYIPQRLAEEEAAKVVDALVDCSPRPMLGRAPPLQEATFPYFRAATSSSFARSVWGAALAFQHPGRYRRLRGLYNSQWSQQVGGLERAYV